MIQATLNEESGTTVYDCIFSVCPNPTCRMASIDIELLPADKDKGDSQPRHAVVDIKKSAAGTSETLQLTSEEKAFSEWFASVLTDEDYLQISKVFFAKKMKGADNADIKTIDIKFDFDDIEENGTMLAYNDVFPYGFQFYGTLDDYSWVIFDSYCVLSHCNCSDMFLECYKTDGTRTSDTLPAFVISLDYKKKQWDFDETIPTSLSIQDARKMIEELFPDFYKIVAGRHKALKAIYKQNKKRYLKPVPKPGSEKINRNAPCPCGSGKKYKKCCMDR